MKVFLASGHGQITDRDKASDIIRAGANYKEKGSPELAGKIQGNGIAPKIRGVKSGDPYISFKTRPGVVRGNDRSELATGFFPFEKDLLVSFKLRIPESSAVNNGYMYILQGWQPAPREFLGINPMMGIRIAPGTRSTLDFAADRITQGQQHITPSKWHKVDMRLRASGRMQVAVDDQQVLDKAMTFGQSNISKDYRIKFGAYGLSQQDPFKIHYKDMVIGLSEDL